MTSEDSYERWSYGEGLKTGQDWGRSEGFGEGYSAGFDAGAQVGAGRVLDSLKSYLGEELLDSLIAQGEARLPHTSGYEDRTRFTQPEGRPEWKGTDNGAQLPTWETDEVDRTVARIDQRRRDRGDSRGMGATA